MSSHEEESYSLGTSNRICKERNAIVLAKIGVSAELDACPTICIEWMLSFRSVHEYLSYLTVWLAQSPTKRRIKGWSIKLVQAAKGSCHNFYYVAQKRHTDVPHQNKKTMNT